MLKIQHQGSSVTRVITSNMDVGRLYTMLVDKQGKRALVNMGRRTVPRRGSGNVLHPSVVDASSAIAVYRHEGLHLKLIEVWKQGTFWPTLTLGECETAYTITGLLPKGLRSDPLGLRFVLGFHTAAGFQVPEQAYLDRYVEVEFSDQLPL